MEKNELEIINYMKNNKCFIFDSAVKGIEDYKLPVDVTLKHVIIYLHNQVLLQKRILDTLNEKN